MQRGEFSEPTLQTNGTEPDLQTLNVQALITRSTPDKINNKSQILTQQQRYDKVLGDRSEDNIASWMTTQSSKAVDDPPVMMPAIATSTPLNTTLDIDSEAKDTSTKNYSPQLSMDEHLQSDADMLREIEQHLAALQDNFPTADNESGSDTDESNANENHASASNNGDDDDDDDDDDEIDFHDIFDIMDLNNIDGIFSGVNELPEPLYPMGPLKYRECIVCLEMKDLNLRTCCAEAVCDDCVFTYVTIQIEQANVKIGCPNDGCDKYVHKDEVMTRISGEMKEKYLKFLVDANKEAHIKTCPRCSTITSIDPDVLKNSKVKKKGLRKTCTVCELDWCFQCQAPWHEGISCKNFKKGDKLLKNWAKSKQSGQTNAQRCPKCKIYIQRSSGCDHMTCTKCQMDFCYRCGERHIKIKFLGDHYTRLSVFGCKYRFLPNNPIRRKLTRGSILAAKTALLPVLAAVAIGVGAIVITVGIFVLPVWGGVKIHRHIKSKKRKKEDKLHTELWRKKILEIHNHGDPYIENFYRQNPIAVAYGVKAGKRGTLIVDELDMRRVTAVSDDRTAATHSDSFTSDDISMLSINMDDNTTIQLSPHNIDIHAPLNDKEINHMNNSKTCDSISVESSVFSYGGDKDGTTHNGTNTAEVRVSGEQQDVHVTVDCDLTGVDTEAVVKPVMKDCEDVKHNDSLQLVACHSSNDNMHLKDQICFSSEVSANSNKDNKRISHTTNNNKNISVTNDTRATKSEEKVCIVKSNSLPLSSLKSIDDVSRNNKTEVVSKDAGLLINNKVGGSSSVVGMKWDESKVKRLVSQYSCGFKSQSDEAHDTSHDHMQYTSASLKDVSLKAKKDVVYYNGNMGCSLSKINHVLCTKVVKDVQDMDGVELKEHMSSFSCDGGVRKLVRQYSDNNNTANSVFYV